MNIILPSRFARFMALALALLALLLALLLAPVPTAAPAAAQDSERALFPVCRAGKRVTCVVDGDTIWYRGAKIRIADIDTPEVAQPACPREAALGRQATERLRALLNAGAFTLEPPPGGRTRDRFGRELRVVKRGGQSLGEVLVREGLAERWGGPRRTWC
jgi:endonuclease YncB( thermonuclease family)